MCHLATVLVRGVGRGTALHPACTLHTSPRYATAGSAAPSPLSAPAASPRPRHYRAAPAYERDSAGGEPPCRPGWFQRRPLGGASVGIDRRGRRPTAEPFGSDLSRGAGDLRCLGAWRDAGRPQADRTVGSRIGACPSIQQRGPGHGSERPGLELVSGQDAGNATSGKLLDRSVHWYHVLLNGADSGDIHDVRGWCFRRRKLEVLITETKKFS